MERITLLTPGTYPIQEARDGGAHTYDLIITQTSLSGPINQALEYLNGCISKYNKWLESSRGDGGLMYTNTVTKWVSKAPQKFPTMQPLLSHGRLSKAVAHLNGDTLAKAYKLEGKKVSVATRSYTSKARLSCLTHSCRYLKLTARTTSLATSTVSEIGSLRSVDVSRTSG